MLKIGNIKISTFKAWQGNMHKQYIYISKCSVQPKSHQLSFFSLPLLTLRCPASVLGNAWNWEKWWSPSRSGWPMAIFERVQRVDTSWVEIDKLSGTDRGKESTSLWGYISSIFSNAFDVFCKGHLFCVVFFSLERGSCWKETGCKMDLAKSGI